MGCLNSEGKFNHWFGNIHLSGPCNRKCYFCIGQHMMALDKYNVLDKWPLDGLDKFAEVCRARKIRDVYLTGTNTDPFLYKHMEELHDWVRRELPGVNFGIRTNGVLALNKGARKVWRLFDKASITVCSLNEQINRAMMGGPPAPLENIARFVDNGPGFKVNIVLGPENTRKERSPRILGDGPGDIINTIYECQVGGIQRVNLREPYGQPHVGDPLAGMFLRGKRLFGMQQYLVWDVAVLYWDVHYVEVESVNLYANGRVSETYPITKGCADDGIVLDQTHFTKFGRVREQWVGE